MTGWCWTPKCPTTTFVTRSVMFEKILGLCKLIEHSKKNEHCWTPYAFRAVLFRGYSAKWTNCDKKLKDIYTQRLKPRWKNQALITAKIDTFNKQGTKHAHVLFVDTRLVFWRGCIALRGHRGDFGIWLNAPPWIWCGGSQSGTRSFSFLSQFVHFAV